MPSIVVLLLTHSGDFYTIDLVQQALQEQGTPFFRVNTDLLPVHYPLSLGFSGNAEPSVTFHLEDAPLTLTSSQVKGVWARRLWPAQFPEVCPVELVQQCQPAAAQLVLDGLALFQDAVWLNPMDTGSRAESKILQLSLAAEVGLPYPETLISNDAEQVREFFQRHDGNLVTKLLVPAVVSMEFNEQFVYTCLVTQEHLQQLEQLRGRPQIFQPFIPKVREYRVVVVGDRFFVGVMNIPKEGPLSVDWRQGTEDDQLQWTNGELPQEISDKALQLLDLLGLNFGVFDFVETPDGDFYFLEVNQAGEWGMLQRDLGLPIAQTIALELSR